MHEFGIAQSVIEIVEREAAARSAARVCSVWLRVGELSGVDAESLTFCFECILRGGPMNGAQLRIDRTTGTELEISQIEVEVPDGSSH